MVDVYSKSINQVFSAGGDILFILPHFQREYAWGEENWRTLLNDVLDVYEAYFDEEEPEHFMGALVVISAGNKSGTIPAFKLVDGQQRLTTISLFLCALAKSIQGNEAHRFTFEKIQRLLFNPYSEDELRYKVLPTRKYGDQEAYKALLLGRPIPAGNSSRIPKAFDFFANALQARLAKNLDPDKLFRVLANSLQVVFISLKQNERPYEIFESLNAKGKPLTQADLVRNYVAMRLPEKDQITIFDEHWVKVETELQENRIFGRSSYGEITAFMRHYLAMHSGVLPNFDHTYSRFRDLTQKRPAEEFGQEIKLLAQYASYYSRLLHPERETDEEIQERLQRLLVMDIATAYPFLLRAYHEMAQGNISKEAFITGLETIENYLVRRFLVGEPTNFTNKMFPALWRSGEVNVGDYTGSLRRALAGKNYPTDHRLRQTTVQEPLYAQISKDKVMLILFTINIYLSQGTDGHTVLNNDPTIEHIMPQTHTPEWRSHLGPDWEQIHEDYLHTLGNLTIVSGKVNPRLGNQPFEVKRAELGHHALLINSSYFGAGVERWDESAIRTRAEYLIDQVVAIWPSFADSSVTRVDSQITSPSLLTIKGEPFNVKTWYGVVEAFLNWTVQNGLFDAVRPEMPSLTAEKPHSPAVQITNGLWLKTHLSSKTSRAACRRIAEAAGLTDDDWQID